MLQFLHKFVAMRLGENYTIEEQVTGRGTLGGIQIDVFPSFDLYFCCSTPRGDILDITKTPRQLGLTEADEILMDTPYVLSFRQWLLRDGLQGFPSVSHS